MNSSSDPATRPARQARQGRERPGAPRKSRPRRAPSRRDAVIEQITEVTPAVRKVFDVRPTGEERAKWMSLTAHQLEALSALFDGSLSMRALCERLDISESAGTALSDRLVSHGMVERESDLSDRRVVRLSLSAEARTMVERFRELKRARIAEVLSVLDDDELESLARVYARLLSSSARGGDHSGLARTPGATSDAERAGRSRPVRQKASAARVADRGTDCGAVDGAVARRGR